MTKKFTKEETAEISRRATHDYFVDGKEEGLIKLIEIIHSIFLGKVKAMNLPTDDIEETLNQLDEKIIKTTKSYKVDNESDTSSFVTYFHYQLIGHIQTMVFENNYPHLNSGKRSNINLSKIVNHDSEEEVERKISEKGNGISRDRIENMRKLMQTSTVSMDSTITNNPDDENVDSFHAFLYDEEAPSIERCADNERLFDFLNESLNALDDPIKESVYLYHSEGKTLDEVSAIVGVSRERVRQRIAIGVRALKKDLLNNYTPDSIEEMKTEYDL